MKKTLLKKLGLKEEYLISRDKLRFIHGGEEPTSFGDTGGGSHLCQSNDDCPLGCEELWPERNYTICSDCCLI